MVRKPWAIIILTSIFILIPIGNIITSYIVSPYKVSLNDFLYSLFAFKVNRLALLELIIPSLIAAYATYSVKKWSYIVLGLFVMWVFCSGAYDLYSHYGQVNFVQIFFIFVVPTLFSLGVTLYFFIPAVKTTYFDPKVRWWEAKPRYITELEAKIVTSEVQEICKVTNLSEGGAFLETNIDFTQDQEFELIILTPEQSIEVQSKIVFRKGSEHAYGVQFLSENKGSLNNIKKLIAQLKKDGAKLSRPLPLWDKDLKEWAVKVIKTGKGLTPEIPSKYKTK